MGVLENAIAACEVCTAESKWPGGSHYHCGGCGAVGGMYGHWTTLCRVTYVEGGFHACCPGHCALAG